MRFLAFVESLISGMIPFVFLMIFGVYLTLKTNGYQFRNLVNSFNCFKSNSNAEKGGVSSFKAVCNSLSASVGTGNIAGVASAISLGGAGAVFWMWVSAIVGMCVKSAEIVTAIIYRQRNGKEYIGGPMYYIKNGLPKRFWFLASVFSATSVFSVIGTGNLTQINACVLSISENFSVRLFWGILLAVLVGFVIIGGVEKISNFTSKTVPLMAVLYILACLGVIFKNIELLPKAFSDIFVGAFNPKAVTGGAVGAVLNTVLTGAKKGVFSNESGLGTSAMAHAVASDATPKKQGLFGIFEVFVDTILICTLTALTILCSGVIIDYGKDATSRLVQMSFSTIYGSFSNILLSLMLCLFAISSVIGWAYYGISCTDYLFGKRGKNLFVKIYPLFCILGAVCNVTLVWRVAEFFNGIMLVVNLFAVILLSDRVIPILKG